MPQVSASPPRVLSYDDITPCKDSSSSSSSTMRKSVSLSWLPKLRIRRRSSATFEMNQEESDSFSGSDEESLDTPRMAGGCLKIPTHAMSLNETYESPLGLDAHHSGVTFGNIDVLIFPLQLGDNPSVSQGPPVAMGHELHARLSLTVDKYEETRPPRREKQELALPRSIREDWLRDEGVARSQWRQREEELMVIKKSRKANQSGLNSKFFLRLFNAAGSTKRPKRTSVLRK